MTDATGVLVAPSDAPVIPDLVNNMLGFSQYISPSYWIDWGIKQAFGFSPIEVVTKTVAGDWNAVSQAGRSLEILGTYCDEVAAQIHTASTTAAADWDGEAAEAAQLYFSTLSTAIQEQADALRSAGGEYLAVSAGMEQTAALIGSLLSQAMDWLIIAAASAAATAASSWTGIGAIVGGTATAASIIKVVTLANQIMDAHDLAVNMCNGSIGVIAGFLGAIHDFESTALPASYDNKVVA